MRILRTEKISFNFAICIVITYINGDKATFVLSFADKKYLKNKNLDNLNPEDK